MKRMLAALPLVLVLCVASAAMVSAQTQPHWRFYLRADNGYNMNSMAAATIGVHPDATDGFGVDGTASDDQDGRLAVPPFENTRGVIPVFGDCGYSKDVKSPRLPNDPLYSAGQPGPNGSTFGAYPYEARTKIWDLRVFCLPTNYNNTSNILRLSFQVIGSTMLPPAALVGHPVSYALRMVDNRGKTGAPENGTTWNIPVPTGGAPLDTWYTINLPLLVVSDTTAEAAMAEGYRMQFIQTIPEPSSLLALATGLTGLAGYAIRRRR